MPILESVPSIFSMVTSQAVKAYWDNRPELTEPYLGEELWDRGRQQMSLTLEWVKGASGLPVVLKPSAYNAVAQKRDRIGFGLMMARMPFFKEAMYIDEELRRQLNEALSNGNKMVARIILENVFNDVSNLLSGARAQRERMRMQLLTTGLISISANGQFYDYDYGIPEENKVEKNDWSTNEDLDVIDFLKECQQKVLDKTGVKPVRAVMRSKTFAPLRKKKLLRQGILGSDSTAPVSDRSIKSYIKDETDIEIVLYDKKAVDESKKEFAYIPDDTISLFPAGSLGSDWYSVTPEQADLMTGNAANVSITDIGVAITTSQHVDPVSVETKVSMIYMPDFPMANNVILIDTSTE